MLLIKVEIKVGGGGGEKERDPPTRKLQLGRKSLSRTLPFPIKNEEEEARKTVRSTLIMLLRRKAATAGHSNSQLAPFTIIFAQNDAQA